MNYFDKIQIIRNILNTDEVKLKTHVHSLLTDYADRAVLMKYSGKEIENSNPFRADFIGTRKYTDKKFFVKNFLYHMYRPEIRVGEGREGNLLLSYNLNQRFSELSKRLAGARKCFVLMTKTNVMFARRFSDVVIIKCDSLFYDKDIEKDLGFLTALVKQAVEKRTGVNWLEYSQILTKLESDLNRVTDALAALLKKNRIEQYITPFPGRYEELLINLACKKSDIVTKELCHGVNSHNLKNSDNVVPTFTDYLYVWNQQFYDNISSFGDMSRVKICKYPKFSYEEALKLNEKFKTQPVLTYFSQPTYDLGAKVSEVVTPEFAEEEGKWRAELFEILRSYAEQNQMRVRIRYHQGEKGRSYGCDRREEMSRLRSYGFEMSENSLEQDLFESAICLGVNTSALYEAHVMGRHVLQTYFARTGDTNYHNTIQVVRLGDLKRAISQNIGLKSKLVSDVFMNLEDFLSLHEKK